jgi:hypothetical protein
MNINQRFSRVCLARVGEFSVNLEAQALAYRKFFRWKYVAVVLGVTLLYPAYQLFADFLDYTDHIDLGSPKLSPDGSKILIEYSRFGSNSRIVEFDTLAGQLTPLQLPTNYSWVSASYSPDGKYIAAVFQCRSGCEKDEGTIAQVAIIDRRTNSIESITDGELVRHAPVFSPDMKHLYYLEKEFYEVWNDWSKEWKKKWGSSSLMRFDWAKGSNELVFDNNHSNGALDFSTTEFLSHSGEEIYFSILSPGKENPAHKYAIDSEKIYEWLAIKFGEDEKFLLLPENRQAFGMIISASPVTGEFVFTRDNGFTGAPESRSYKYDIYLSKDGEVLRLTHLDKRVASPSISFDGSRVVFMTAKSKQRLWEVEYFDRAQQKVIKTNIRELIRKL